MPLIRLDLQLPDSATQRDILDALAKAKRELEWLLNGNLDEKNMRTLTNVTFGDVAFNGNITIAGGPAIGSLMQNDSTATDVAGLRQDFNALLFKLREYNILLD